jgi:hypothetical protein
MASYSKRGQGSTWTVAPTEEEEQQEEKDVEGSGYSLI